MWDPEWHLKATPVVRVGEVVVAEGVGAQRRVVLCRRERERRAAAPAPHQLGRQQLALRLCLGMRLQEPVERADPRLVLAQPGVRAVAPQRVRSGHRQWHARLAGIAEDELPGFDRSSLAG